MSSNQRAASEKIQKTGHGGKRAGAGRRIGSGRYGEPTKSIRVPISRVEAVEALLASTAVIHAENGMRTRAGRAQPIRIPQRSGEVGVVGPLDARAFMGRLLEQGVHAKVLVLDPPYGANTQAGRQKFARDTKPVLELARRLADHVFVWGFSPALGLLIDQWSRPLQLVNWLIWTYPNAPSRAKGWRPAHQSCLHLATPGARMVPEQFYSSAQADRHRNGTLSFHPGPPNVLQHPLIVGWSLRSEATGYRAQKPQAVLEYILRMVVQPGDLVLDPFAGSGTTAVATAALGGCALVSDRSESAISVIRKRLRKGQADYWYAQG